jgi:hypothetical protein
MSAQAPRRYEDPVDLAGEAGTEPTISPDDREIIRQAWLAGEPSRRRADAWVSSAWENSLDGPFHDARKGNTERLVNYIVGHVLTDAEADQLAPFMPSSTGHAPKRRAALLEGLSIEQAEQLAARVAEKKRAHARPRMDLRREALDAYQSITSNAELEPRCRDNPEWLSRWAKDRDMRLRRACEFALRRAGKAVDPDAVHKLTVGVEALLVKPRRQRR